MARQRAQISEWSAEPLQFGRFRQQVFGDPLLPHELSLSGNFEYGFDVGQQSIVDGSVAFDMMGYCMNRWISPYNYKNMFPLLNGGNVTSANVKTKVESFNPAHVIVNLAKQTNADLIVMIHRYLHEVACHSMAVRMAPKEIVRERMP